MKYLGIFIDEVLSWNKQIEELKTTFAISRSIHSYETRSSMVFHMSRFSSNTLRYDGANIWDKFHHTLLYKEPNLTKAKLKKIISNAFPGQ